MHGGCGGKLRLPAQQEAVEPGIVQQGDTDAAQNLHHYADDDVGGYAEQSLVIGAAEADGHSGIGPQAEGNRGHDAEQQKLHKEADAVDHNIHVVIANYSVGDILHFLPQLAHKADVKGRDKAGQNDNENRGGKPHGRNNELAPYLLVDAHRQGHHHIALVLQKIFIEPADHHRKSHDSNGDNGKEEQHDQDGAKGVQKCALSVCHAPDGEVGTDCGQQQKTEDRQYDPAGGPELMLQ